MEHMLQNRIRSYIIALLSSKKKNIISFDEYNE